MHSRHTLVRLVAVAAVCTAIFASCSGRRIGYGVLLWAPDKSSFKTGQIVTVKSESKINNTYSVVGSGSKSAVDLPTWRIKLFSSEKEAVNYSLSYSPMVPLFAKATANGAAIRDNPDASATRVYRLRQDQVVKVVSKEPKEVTIDGIKGYWYEVLTGDGVLGYSFDANLQVYNPADKTQQQQSVGQLLLDKVLSSTFRPQYFQQMIDNNRIDLKRFSTKFGFFADQQSKTVHIVMPDYDLTFKYSGIQDRGSNDYAFTGTSLEMIIQNPDQIRLLYSDNQGNQQDQTFVQIKQDIGMLVEKERNRRLQVYSTFLDKTPFSSDYYGKINLHSNGSFDWSGYSRLVPNIIPAGAEPSGMVAFPLYLSDGLKGSYDGVISFVFGAKPAAATDPTAGSSQAGSAALGAATSQTGKTTAGGSAASPGGGGSSTQGASSSSGSSSAAAGSTQSGAQTGSASLVPSAQQPQNANLPTVNFLYSFADGGVKLTYVPENTIDKDTVTSVSSTPIVIFFSFK